MAWTAGADVTTGDLITAAQWNSYLGVSGSLEYLNDKIDDCSFDPNPTRAIDTVYQNGASLRLIVVSFTLEDNDTVSIRVGQTVTPASIAGTARNNVNSAGGLDIQVPITACIKQNWYYKAKTDGGSPVIAGWDEWDIH